MTVTAEELIREYIKVSYLKWMIMEGMKKEITDELLKTMRNTERMLDEYDLWELPEETSNEIKKHIKDMFRILHDNFNKAIELLGEEEKLWARVRANLYRPARESCSFVKNVLESLINGAGDGA